jgi:signal peptidase I
MTSTPKNISKKAVRKDRAVEIANTFEYLITAFILAFVFRAFVMEAYRIPTGSMANTLKGAHFRLRCCQCGYEYSYGLGNYGLPPDTLPRQPLRPRTSRCPNCGHYQPTGGTMSIANGDRILVLKCIYQFFEPKRWDVVVFKNPLDPSINYIKRLIGRPTETVEIIDGDIYINGQISRKPAKVQNKLWMPIYDNDYQPVRPRQGSFNGHFWQEPFSITKSKWTLDEANPTRFRLDSDPDQINSLIYETSIGNDFRAAYAYNDVSGYAHMPYCSDLMMRFWAEFAESSDGCIGITLSKYQTHYKAWVDLFGDMVIAKVFEGKETILARRTTESLAVNKPFLVKFANVDHQLIFHLGTEKLTYDLGRLPDAAGPRKTDIASQAEIFGSGKLTLSHIAVFRDIHYTAARFANSNRANRATEGNPFTLGKDEFFVLGDNSPNSQDGRWWHKPGIGNNDRFYRQGTVPREYLVGKALFVYWPSGFKPFPKSRFAVIPNIGKMRFIYGGSD